MVSIHQIYNVTLVDVKQEKQFISRQISEMLKKSEALDL